MSDMERTRANDHRPSASVYLNKGQTYSIFIVDSKPFLQQGGVTYYRTSIRISFTKPSSIYNTPHKNCNLNIVELVHLDEGEDTIGISACALGVRFSFLSKDFSYSKGAKGPPLRLLAKTETITLGIPELKYCKVKVFRNHGAERKMSTDVF
ncbi:CP2 transcription factor [Penicillium angulare]|uniref:CP2 transcription factor n=1 Tax=Penicillium angulare TaxID=116970 RepID=A0A9W9FIC7_9EURO|nr:CP2 transcription factor [Penicillium angulare]